MPRKVFVVFIVLMMAVVLSACGQKAQPIVLPSKDEIHSVELTQGTETTSISEEEWISRFLDAVLKAQPTRKVSVQDQPQVKGYVKIDLKGETSVSTIFFYEEQGAYYLEQPYQGIYRSDAALYEMLVSNH